MKISKEKIRIYLLYTFAFIGILVSSYLWYEYSQPHEITCQVGGCQTVRESDYSSLFGISLPIYGFAYFFGILGYAMSLLFKRKINSIEKIGFILYVTAGFGFSVYLTFLEIFVIHAICMYCLISAAATVGTFFVGYWMYNPLDLFSKQRFKR